MATCDGKLVFAPRDLVASTAHFLVAGSGACVDEYARKTGLDIVDPHSATHQVLGTLELWTFPDCQAHAAHVVWRGDGSVDLSVQLRVQSLGNPRDRWAEEHYLATYDTGIVHGFDAWTVLVWSPTVNVSTCGTISWKQMQETACQPLPVHL